MEKRLRPKLLDLFCKAGGAGMGYYLAGFDVTGVDIDPQPNYPFEFIQGDAIQFLLTHGHEYDVIHASPPCQKASRSTSPHKANGKIYLDLIPITRYVLELIGKPFIIENVPEADIKPDIVLWGPMFGLKVLRKRHFEIGNCFVMQPAINPKNGTVAQGDYCCIFGKGAYRKSKNDAMPKFKKDTVVSTWSLALGIDWKMKDIELAEAIPPAYTEYIGKQIICNFVKTF
jgi:DNA (cytosine-5)-methyltransferase 1